MMRIDSEGCFMVRGGDAPDAPMVSLDNALLRNRLEVAFAKCGIQEQWIVSTLMDVVNSLLGKEDVAKTMTPDRVESSLCRALRDSGFQDVAEFFENSGGDRRPEGFSSGKFPSGSGGGAESKGCGKPGEEDLPLSLRPTRYIGSDEWNLNLTDSQLKLIHGKVIQLMPASDLFPVAAVKCNLMRLYDAAEIPEMELQWMVRLKEISADAHGILKAMCQQMHEQWPEVQKEMAHIYFQDFSSLVKVSAFGTRRKAREQWRMELSRILQDNQVQVLVHLG